MRKQLVIPAIGLLVVGLSSAFWMVSAADPAETVRLTADVTLAKDSDFLSGFVPARTTIAHLFENHMIHSADTPVLVSSIASAIDVRKLRAGQPYAIDRLLDGRVRRFEYEIDADKRLTVRARRRSKARRDSSPPSSASRNRPRSSPSKATSIARPIHCRPRSTRPASASTSRSAWPMCSRARSISIRICSRATSSACWSSATRAKGKLSGYGAILAAEFVNDGRKLRAIRFTPEGGSPAYYDENGRSLKRFFLKSPLKFEPRITSRFSSVAQASDPWLRARAQRRRLLRARRRAGRIGGAGRGDAWPAGPAAAAAP